MIHGPTKRPAFRHRARRPMPNGWLNRLQYASDDWRWNLAAALPRLNPRLTNFLTDIAEFNHDTWNPCLDNGNTVLHDICSRWAGNYGHEPLRIIFEAMRKAGLKLDHQNHAARTALHSACFNRNTDAGKALLDNGASWILLDMSGESPLHDACASKCEPMIHELLARGCDPMLENRHGKAPWQVAQGRGHKEMASVMLVHLEVDMIAQTIASTDSTHAAPARPPRL